MTPKILLDFDGVLFNSAFEAFSVCQAVGKQDDSLRQDVDFKEFLEFRAFVTDAWQYRRLYSPAWGDTPFSTLPHVEPNDEDWEFADAFFAARRAAMTDADWPKVMSPYDFFFLLKPLLVERAESFAILSTRDRASIARTMQFFGVPGLDIHGQEDIRRDGSKIDVARGQGWLTDNRFLVVYVDDMNDHLEPFDGVVHLPLHAGWGYDHTAAHSMSAHQVSAVIHSLLKLSRNA